MADRAIHTVLGPVSPSDLGVVHTHEHLLIDMIAYFSMPEEASEREWVDAPVTMDRIGGLYSRLVSNLANMKLLSEPEAAAELALYYRAGGGAIVDTTSIGIARDPLALARISRATGIHVVMGSSYYVPISYPADLGARSEDEIAQSIISDLTVGVGDTGIKAGVIGEVGNFWPTNETTQTVLRASARASSETGAAIIVHPGFHPDSPPHILETLTAAGANPSRVIMGHLDVFRTDRGWLRELADAGCYMEWDTYGLEDTSLGGGNLDHAQVASDAQRIDRLAYMIEEGFGDRIVIGHDVCTMTQRRLYGGKGYAHILESVVPRLRARGIPEEDIETVLVRNPARALAF